MASSSIMLIVSIAALLSVASGTDAVDHGRKLLQGATFNRNDRVTTAITASIDSINQAAAGDRSVKQATRDGILFSRLAANSNTRPSDFLGGRKLLQGASFDRNDRVTTAITAASDSISAAAAGERGVKQATRDGVLFSRLAANSNTRPSDFLGGRKLLQGATFNRNDRVTTAITASIDSINQAAAGDRSVKQATRDGILFSRLAASSNTRPSDFLGGR